MSDLFVKRISSGNINFKYAKGNSARSGKEFHLFYEIILFLGGKADLITETIHMKLKPETLIVIPKETYHQVVIKGKQEDYCRCVLEFQETENIKNILGNNLQDLFITHMDKNTNFLFSKLVKLADESEHPFKDDYLQSILVLLINEIFDKKSMDIEVELTDELTKQAIKYISENLTNEINLEDMAYALNVSLSTLMHNFKSSMNISIYKYILKKRLILAHAKISNGEAATVVATECGFNDYSGFYRQYKKMFDVTPSSRERK